VIDSAEVFIFPAGKVDPELLLEKAKEWGLKEVLVIGWAEDGELAVGSSEESKRDLLWLLEKAKRFLLNGC